MKKILNKKKRAFSLAELMIVMLILTIILAATMPILSKRAKMKAAAAAAASSAVTLSVVNEGDPCTIPTDSNVSNVLAISTDYTTLLTCKPTATLGSTCTVGTKSVQVVDGVLTQMTCQ